MYDAADDSAWGALASGGGGERVWDAEVAGVRASGGERMRVWDAGAERERCFVIDSDWRYSSMFRRNVQNFLKISYTY